MDINYIKDKVNNYEFCDIEEIEDIIKFIIDQTKEKLNINFEWEIVYDEGGRVKFERSSQGYLQLEIGEWALAEIKNNKELGIEVSKEDERKEFIELILQTFHELRHIEQFYNMQDCPIENEDTLKMTRESIINEFFTGFINRFNYEESCLEIDAMKTSLIKTSHFLQMMNANITPDEVFKVMKEKELQYLDYNLAQFGNSYESAISYFERIYGKFTTIKGIPEIIQSLSKEDKELLYRECQDLINEYNIELNVEKKLEILKEISLRLRSYSR